MNTFFHTYILYRQFIDKNDFLMNTEKNYIHSKPYSDETVFTPENLYSPVLYISM